MMIALLQYFSGFICKNHLQEIMKSCYVKSLQSQNTQKTFCASRSKLFKDQDIPNPDSHLFVKLCSCLPFCMIYRESTSLGVLPLTCWSHSHF